ncbi:MAG: sigma 54-interacting transcriptional regulator, partial [Candidatus Margulisiibacteriota bacterium]
MKQRWIVVKPGSSDETRINLDKSFYQIGRSNEASIRIDNSRISSLHASILIKDDTVTIIDLDSTNGTRVNNKKIKQAELHDNDEIQLSEIKLLFREESITSYNGKNAFETEISAMIQENLFSPQLYRIINNLLNNKNFHEDALVIKNELEQQEKNIKRLESLYSMLETTSSFLDRDTLIEALLLNITRILDLDVCGLYLLDTDSFFIIEDGRLKVESKTKTISKTILDKVLNQGAPLFLENIGTDSEILGFKSLTDFHIQSLLCLPIVNYYKNIIGAMYCVSKKSGQLNILDKDKLFLKATSTIISLSIAGIDKLNREKDFIKHEEKRKQEEKFLPVINNLRQKSEVLSLRYENDDGNILIGLDDLSGKTLSEFIRRAAKADLPVLLTGETGTGKSILSREIHRQGRPLSPFITVDCTTLPPDLIESELFGHEKGAFTGAVSK